MQKVHHQKPSQKSGRPATKDYACKACGKLFYFQGNLTKHIKRFHEGIKKKKEHICDSCGKEFYTARPQNLIFVSPPIGGHQIRRCLKVFWTDPQVPKSLLVRLPDP